MSERDDCNCGFQRYGAALAHRPGCPYRIRIETEKLPERMRKVALDLPVPDDMTNREYWLRTEIMEWADEVAVVLGKLLPYEQREDGNEFCEAHEDWLPIEEMHMDSEGVWLCHESWNELVNAMIDEIGEAGGILYERRT